MNEYLFLYKARGHWQTASNPVFIAKHTYCRAIPREIIEKSSFDLVGDFVFMVNENENITEEAMEIIREWEIY